MISDICVIFVYLILRVSQFGLTLVRWCLCSLPSFMFATLIYVRCRHWMRYWKTHWLSEVDHCLLLWTICTYSPVLVNTSFKFTYYMLYLQPSEPHYVWLTRSALASKGRICQFVKWQVWPFGTKEHICYLLWTVLLLLSPCVWSVP